MREREKVRPIGRSDSGARRQSGADGTSRSETFTLDGAETDGARPALMAYCTSCRARRSVLDWRERGDVLLVDVEPCGHVIELTARLEWLPYREPARARFAGMPARPRARVASLGA